ncbi:Uma2 family endonuclease [Bradyrhizobium guangdongense]|uniref:Uma2 family endonuclease n=1 Tax=Bradyrhizobium guangdongense TaxID=1325090 RepID=UPI00131A16C8|nr:Uma2 family endonuclease [Bradyrhizobium guangdongense]
MAEEKQLTVDEFLKAIIDLDGRFELVRGVAYAFAGATEGHNVIWSNVLTVLVPSGKRKGCRTTSSAAVQTGPDTVRHSDVVVDCGPPNAMALTASWPTIVVEVSSSGTAVFDYDAKLREYQGVESINTVLEIESEIARVKVHRRQESGTWTDETVEEFGIAIPLTTLATSITLNEIYDTLEVKPRPRLQVVQNNPSKSM